MSSKLKGPEPKTTSASTFVTAPGVCESGAGTSFAVWQADKTNKGMRMNGMIIDPLDNNKFFMGLSFS